MTLRRVQHRERGCEGIMTRLEWVKTHASSSSLCFLAALSLFGASAGAQLYQDTTPPAFNNFIPLGPDGTPGRPTPGDHMGNQITLAGTNRLLDNIHLYFGLNTNFG